MLYTQEITIPDNTSKTSYQKDTIKITKGVITRISVFFPWGCAGLVKVQVIRKTWQIYPLSRGQWLSGNDKEFDFSTRIDITSEPYELIIYSYNEDDTYEHSPIICVEMVKGTVPERFKMLMGELGA